jgi:hypothetical protein
LPLEQIKEVKENLEFKENRVNYERFWEIIRAKL